MKSDGANLKLRKLFKMEIGFCQIVKARLLRITYCGLCQPKNLIFVLFNEFKTDLQICIGPDIIRFEPQSGMEMFDSLL